MKSLLVLPTLILSTHAQLLGALTGALNSVSSSLTNTVNNAVSGAGSAVADTLSGLTQSANALVDPLDTAATGLVQAVPRFVNAVLPPAGQVAVSAVQVVAQPVMGLLASEARQPNTGCRAGSVSTTFNENRTALTILFDDFQAVLGPGIPANQNRRTCSIKLDLQVPPGWQYEVSGVDYRGYVQLDRGVDGLLEMSYFFSSNLNDQTRTQKTIRGPMSSNYLAHQSSERKSRQVWLPCTRSSNSELNIQTVISLRKAGQNSKGTGIIREESTDASGKKFKMVNNLGWKQC